MVAGAQSQEVGVEEGGPFLEEGVGGEGPCLVVEEVVGVEVRNQAGVEEVVELQYLMEGAVVVGVGNKVQARVRVGVVVEVAVEVQWNRLVKVVVVEEVVVVVGT